uniref:Uncharacterized protein n=1 Tax=Anopheles atroparvus TaxID=41427 RepID=A0AAG5DJW1_ANOAO
MQRSITNEVTVKKRAPSRGAISGKVNTPRGRNKTHRRPGTNFSLRRRGCRENENLRMIYRPSAASVGSLKSHPQANATWKAIRGLTATAETLRKVGLKLTIRIRIEMKAK